MFANSKTRVAFSRNFSSRETLSGLAHNLRWFFGNRIKLRAQHSHRKFELTTHHRRRRRVGTLRVARKRSREFFGKQWARVHTRRGSEFAGVEMCWRIRQSWMNEPSSTSSSSLSLLILSTITLSLWATANEHDSLVKKPMSATL